MILAMWMLMLLIVALGFWLDRRNKRAEEDRRADALAADMRQRTEWMNATKPIHEAQKAAIKAEFPGYLGGWNPPPVPPFDGPSIPGLSDGIKLTFDLLAALAVDRRLVSHWPEHDETEISLCRWHGKCKRIRVRPAQQSCQWRYSMGIVDPPTSICVDETLRIISVVRSAEDANTYAD